MVPVPIKQILCCDPRWCDPRWPPSPERFAGHDDTVGLFAASHACCSCIRRPWRSESHSGPPGANFSEHRCSRQIALRGLRICHPWPSAAIGGVESGLTGWPAARGRAGGRRREQTQAGPCPREHMRVHARCSSGPPREAWVHGYLVPLPCRSGVLLARRKGVAQALLGAVFRNRCRNEAVRPKQKCSLGAQQVLRRHVRTLLRRLLSAGSDARQQHNNYPNIS